MILQPQRTSILLVALQLLTYCIGSFAQMEFHITAIENQSDGVLLELDREQGTIILHVDNEDVVEEYFIFREGFIEVNKTIDRDDIAQRTGTGRTYDRVEITFNYVWQNLSRSEVFLYIIDENDNIPMFSTESVLVEISEGLLESEPLEKAMDMDEGNNSVRSYSLLNDIDGLFILDIRMDSTGYITQVLLKNTRILDRETVDRYTLELQATEGTSNPRTAVRVLNVTVTDVCDKSPAFMMSRYHPSAIPEDSPLGTVVFRNITAYDEDLVDRDGLNYHINEVCRRPTTDQPCQSVTDSQHPFLLDMENGLLTLEGELDREEFALYEVSVHATDQCGRSASATVVVQIGDVNDNCPQIDFDPSVINGEIKETFSNFPTNIGFFTIHDIDSGANGNFTVQLFEEVEGDLLPSSTFQLLTHSATLELVLIQRIDREVRDQYSLVIRATDFGVPSCNTTYNLILTVEDFNDNPPIIQRENLDPVYQIREESPENFEIVTVVADDADDVDSGNGLVTYELPGMNETFPYQDLFQIENVTGTLKVAGRLNREVQQNFFVLVVASDNPNKRDPTLSDSVIINITLQDINDNYPIIHYPTGTIQVPENFSPASHLFTINATDLDTTEFSTLTYTITPANGPFSINTGNGEVFLRESGLDFEQTPQYNLTIHVTDGSLSSEEELTISVINVNDEHPQFEPSSLLVGRNIEEGNQVIGLHVATINVTDPDMMTDNLRLQIESGNELGHFSIDPVTGRITTNATLNKEAVSNYTLTISANDGELYAQQNAIVIVDVLDINDNPPMFIGTPYHFQVSEQYPINTVVRGETEDDVVHATDLDTGENRLIHYEIIGATPAEGNEWFLIDTMTGRITTKEVLDRESPVLGADGIVRLSVEANNPGESGIRSIVEVAITIVDINDQSPSFEEPNVTIDLSENHETGATFYVVQAIDEDQPPNNEILYSILNSPPGIQDQFFIHEMRGELRLISQLDHETQDRLEFRVQATDANDPLRHDTQIIVINVIDAKEPCLRLDFNPLVDLNENSPPNTQVITFKATNLEGQSVSSVVYTLSNLDGSLSLEFDISENQDLKATVHTATRNIDREVLVSETGQAIYQLNITAHDTLSSQECVTISSVLTVTILDVNDNPPRFSARIYNFSVVENRAAGTRAGIVSAMDMDEGDNSLISFSIVPSDASVPFVVNSDGEIRTTGPLDHDPPSSSLYTFTVQAQDNGDSPMSSSAVVRVQVIDVNDNDPEFDRNQNRTFVVPEDKRVGQKIATIRVSDIDSGEFGEVTITLNQGSRLDQHFQLNADGTIYLVQELDRETEESYSFEVRARDGDGRSSTAVIKIVVSDVNDNAPIFNLEPIQDILLPENTPVGTTITQVTAIDDDIGLNGEVSYALEDNSLGQTFCIHSTTGEIYLCIPIETCTRPTDNRQIPAIDYERQSSYDVTIFAYDQALPRHFDTKTIHIKITNVNEHGPVFDSNFIVVLVDEGQTSGTEVVQIKAYDWDYDSLTYSVWENGELSENFRYQNGAIVTSTVLNYDIKNDYQLILRVQELNTAELLHETTMVTVHVRNINNLPPVFDTTYYPTSTEIPESTQVGSKVLKVYATDVDNNTNDAVSYEITNGNVGEVFTIDSRTGDVSVNSTLDYDSVSAYTLTVVAKDTGHPQLSSTSLPLTITLKNINDEPPMFTDDSYQFELTENSPIGTVVDRVRATDRDLDPYGNVRYYLPDVANNAANGYFEVNEITGDLTSLVEFDRESSVKTQFVFTVEASDNEQRTSTQVTVNIVDANDNPPMFSRYQYYVPVTQSQQAGVPIFNLGPEVSDIDQNENAHSTFEVESQISGDLIEVSLDGQVMLRSVPQDQIYEAKVRVFNTQQRTMFDEAFIRVVVEGDNDHHPRFNQLGGYSVRVREDSMIGATVFNMTEHVSDPDTGANGALSFSFQQPYPQFSISASGLITLRDTLDYEGVKSYTLFVAVTDGAQRTTETSLYITVTSFNDNPPVFDNVPERLQLSTVPRINIDLFTVTATDNDEGSDGIVRYSLSENGDTSIYFDIDPVLGIVRSKGPLSAGSWFNLTVTAFDNGFPLKSTDAVILVSIHEVVSGNTPVFVFNGVPPSVLSIDVDEDETESLLTSLFTQPQAEEFKLVYTDAPAGLFSVSRTQGSLLLQGELDYRESQEYELIVEAYIENTGNLNNIFRYSSYLTVNIHVNDVNNIVPEFRPSTHTLEIAEDASIDSFVFQALAFDDDSGTNGELNYEIREGNFGGVFRINATSGEITLRRSLDRETSHSYDLKVRAFDLTSLPNFGELALHIDVTDVNDYAPRFIQDGNFSVGVYEYPHTGSGDGIIKLDVIDLDEGPPLRYELYLIEAGFRGNPIPSPNQDTFEINRDTGLISLSSIGQLDYESTDYYLLQIQATDLQTTAVTFLEINVLDVNDHYPQISTEKTVIDVWEQQPVGSFVAQFSSTDSDEGINGVVTYSLGEDWSRNAGDSFAIDPHTGAIRINSPLIATPELLTFSATVYATDQGISPKSHSITVTVRVDDVNDHSPTFSKESYVFGISVGASTSTYVGTFGARDEDYHQNSGIHVEIPHYYSEANTYFGINSDHTAEGYEGNLSLKTTQGLQAKNYTFRLEAQNPSYIPSCPVYRSISYAEVTVVVYPECPEFFSTVHTVEVVEEQFSTDVLVQLSARSTVGRQVEYFINDTLERPFTLDRNNGQLTLSSALDRETLDFYEFYVAATDSIFQPLTCSALVRVTVLDINDNNPTFSPSEYFASVKENQEPPIFVGTVSANDLDLDNTVHYELAPITTVPFIVNRTSGDIYAAAMFDAEDIESYTFRVRAYDNGPDPRDGFVTVQVTITDVNEFRPEFPDTTYTFPAVSPDFRTGDIIGRVVAQDADKRSQLIYSFVNDEPKLYFEINNRTGDIILIASQTQSSSTVTKRSIQKRQTESSSDYFTVRGVVLATDGTNNATTNVDISLHNSYRVSVPVPFDHTQIIIIVAALVFVVIAVFLLLIIVACVCRQRRISKKVQIKDSATPNNMELGSRFSSRRSHGGSRSSTPSKYKETTTNNVYPLGHTTLHHSSGSGSNSSRQSYSNYADDEMDSTNGDAIGRSAYSSSGLPLKPPKHPSPRTRSTSDLASSVGTDMLGSQQLPHPKARIAAIYAAHHELLNQHGSRESIHSNHTFASEGGGEADAEADINNMMYSKYEFEDDDDDDVTTLPDDSSYISKDRQSMSDSAGNLNVPPVEEDMPPYPYSQPMGDWVPHATPMEHAINEINELASYSSSQEHHIPVPRYHEHSQPASMYGGASSQGSRISLLRHHGQRQPRHYEMQPQMVPPMTHEYEYFRTPPQDPRQNRRMVSQQRYGSASALSIPPDYGLVPPREILSSRVDPRVDPRMDPRLHQSRGHPPHMMLSQEVAPTYLQQSYLPRGVNTHTPSSDTPTDGTVTPQRAMAMGQDYDHGGYMSSSSTSLGSTNLSGTTSSIGHSASQRMYPK